MGKSGKNTRTYFIDRKNVDFKIHSESSSSVGLVQGRAWNSWTTQVRGLDPKPGPKLLILPRAIVNLWVSFFWVDF